MCETTASSLSVAFLHYYPDHDGPVVEVTLGDTSIAVLPPVRASRAGHGDDSSYFLSEERAIAEETAAPYLRTVFQKGS